MKILAIDGNSILSRAFYGIRPLTTAEGIPTNAIYGFLSTYLKTCEEIAPDAAVVCFDLKAPTYRHMEYAAYKAGRRPTPPELIQQIPLMKDVLRKMGVMCCELEGYEADDLLGTISQDCEDCPDCQCVILTGDRDSFQLAGENTTIRLVTTKAGHPVTTDYTPAVIAETFGVTPPLMIDVKALMGDASDNIPGVAGIGEKTALSLVQKYGGIEAIYRDLDTLDIRETLRQKLRDGEESAWMSRRLAEIDRQAPLSFTPQEAIAYPADEAGLFALLRKLELRSFITRMHLSAAAESAPEAPKTAVAPAAIIADPDALAALSARLQKITEPAALLTEEALDWVAVDDGAGTALIRRADFTDEAYDAFLDLLFSDAVPKTVHDGKALYVALLSENRPVRGFAFDSAVAAYLLNPATGKYELSRIAPAYLDEELPEAVYQKDEAFSPLSDPAPALAALSAHLSAIRRLRPLLTGKLEEEGMTSLMFDMELPLMEVLSAMQVVGVRIDRDRLITYGEELSAQVAALEEAIYQAAGETFNINSPKQLGEILFDKMGLPAGKKTKSGYSTDADALQKVAALHPIGGLLLEYRQLAKLKSTYAEGLLKVISPADGRIHSSFHQLTTATGRISSTEPNMQNIPVRQERGAELRRMFVAEPGWRLIDADYSQIELRILAHISDDPGMKAAFASGQDIHRMTAASVEGVAPEDVTPAMRSRAKAVNFGLVYGMSDFSLAAQIGVTRKEAKAYIENYFAMFPGVRRYMDEIKAKAKEEGSVSTLSGRRRPLPEIQSTNFNVRSFGERVALNTPIQGTAADVIKLAMVAVYRRLQEAGMRTRLILQVHDELILEAPEDEVARATALLTEEMQNAMSLSVALVADAGVGEDWYHAKG
ncbi:MAG: DNA polymerase I [Ruminococcaceae bacterium]|nr:DNA polymerase I [Oscillospiraceae bacterium]